MISEASAEDRAWHCYGLATGTKVASLKPLMIELSTVYSMIVRFDADCERFRAQLKHLCFFYGISARRLGMHLAHDPTRAYGYLNGTKLPTWRTRREWRAFMRRYRKSIKI